jgi:hypothetical protein
MKRITRLSLALIMFSLFSISYLVTSVSAQNGTKCGKPQNAWCTAMEIHNSSSSMNSGGSSDSMGAPAPFDDGLMGAPAMVAPGTMGHNPAAGMPGTGAPYMGAPGAAGMPGTGAPYMGAPGAAGMPGTGAPYMGAPGYAPGGPAMAPGSAAAGGPCADFAPGTPPRQSCERQHGGR